MKPTCIFAAAISLLALTAASCASDGKDEPFMFEVTAEDLVGKVLTSLEPELVPGHSEEGAHESLYFESDTEVHWQWSFLDRCGVWGDGSYTVRDNVITIKYPSLFVLSDYEYGSFGGLIDGQSYLERYTIMSYDGQYMTLINTDGRQERFIVS